MADIPFDFAPLTPDDLVAIDRLDARAFGPGRFAKTAYRLREGVEPDWNLSFVARIGTLVVGANRVTPIVCGGAPALLLGPLTVEPAFRSRGLGEALVMKSLDAARKAGHSLVLLVGDAPYYERLGFRGVPKDQLIMPGPVDPERVLCCELQAGALTAMKGKITRV
jgi:predicted N-acetyltransferase YhbS